MSIRLTIDLRGASRFRAALQKTMHEGTVQFELMNRLGLTVLRWVDKNFVSGGGRVGGWSPLRPLTIFGRRQGSSVPLGDTGRLRMSFTAAATDTEVRVGTALPIARWHQYGTHAYDIVPKVAHALAFPAPPGGGGGLYVRRRPAGTPVVGMTTASAVKAAGGALPAGKGGFQSFAVVKKVHFPGLPARRMLPNEGEIREELQKTIVDWVNEHLTKTGLKGVSGPPGSSD